MCPANPTIMMGDFVHKLKKSSTPYADKMTPTCWNFIFDIQPPLGDYNHILFHS